MNFLFLFSILKMLADPGENVRFQPAMFNSFVSTQFILKFYKNGDIRNVKACFITIV